MAAELEKLAAEFGLRGFPSLGEEIQAIALRARILGVPDSFSEPEATVVFADLAKALTWGEPRADGDATLTPELATHFNKEFGGRLPDNIPLLNLRYPTQHGRAFLSPDDQELDRKVDERVATQYNRGLGTLRRKLKTLGDFRNLTHEKAFTMTNLGAPTYWFFKIAFNPAPPTPAPVPRQMQPLT